MFSEALSGCGGGDETEWEERLLGANGRIVYLPRAWVWHQRTSAELRVSYLLGLAFQRGRERVAFARVRGQKLKRRQELLASLRFLAHAVRRVCVGGLISASRHVGTAWELTIRGEH